MRTFPKQEWIKKALVLGSGAIKIAEAGEFDYSGSQCLKALREEGIKTVLINPNIATIQTDSKMSDKVYFLPITPEYVERIIEEERPDAILLGFGGQTALNCGVQLSKLGILDKYDVKVIGTPIKGIELTEDRELFKESMIKAKVPVLESAPAYSLDEARKIARELGYPVIIRVAYTLGGKGGGVAKNELELDEIVERGLNLSLINQVLIERYIGEWRQIEYEVMRDSYDNCITVCNMENILKMRVHTGDNIVIAPSQTLNNREYHILRSASIRAAREVEVIGECNIQFAIDNDSEDYYAIEINARLSRSSALASKATGYPLAYMAAKLALGYSLTELLNKVTKVTTACFEPSLDYVVVKFPRWDLSKFERVSKAIGTQMKSVGEVMAIGRKFEEALQKAIRMLDIGKEGLIFTDSDDYTVEELEARLVHPSDEILFDVVRALKKGMSVERVSRLAVIDKWFVAKIKGVLDLADKISHIGYEGLKKNSELLLEAKKLGFSDKQIALLCSVKEEEIRELRKNNGIIPKVKHIDTLAAEWPSKTNYLYLSYNASFDELEPEDSNEKKVIVLGAGTYRIGSSVEFDWCTVNMVWALKNNGIKQAIIINCNPETVSTDYDISDKLYFEELTLERVLDIYEKEKPLGIISSVGGQIANNLTPKLAKYGVKILGTDSRNVDRAEDRSKFSKLLDELNIPQPPWSEFRSLEEASAFADKIGYPLLVRPSYVLSGSAMRVIWTSDQLKKYLTRAAKVSPEHPVVISKFLQGCMEVEVDGVCDGRNVFIGAVIEHVEEAGIHSGDAIMCIPPQNLSKGSTGIVMEYSRKIARALEVKGPFNIQYLVKDGKVYVIECNLRASRSIPFVSKTIGVNLIDMACRALLNKGIKEGIGWSYNMNKVGVKVPQFSFVQLTGADPVLGVEMQSTGEVACFGKDFFDALCKAIMAAGFTIPKGKAKAFITVGGLELKEKLLPLCKDLKEAGFDIYATEHTAKYLRRYNIDVTILNKISERDRKPNIADFLARGKLDLIINIPSTQTLEKYADMLEDEYIIRRKAVELGIPTFTNWNTAKVFVEGILWMKKYKPTIEIQA
ncbi:MAG: carbamoyl-phosphate synthase (glutamine-hydrolyzing) large subunit [Nitrososphaerales archaeon]